MTNFPSLRGRGRPRTHGRPINVRVSPEELREIDKLAVNGATRPEIIRRLIREALDKGN